MGTSIIAKATSDHARKAATKADVKASEPQSFGDFLSTLSKGEGPIPGDLLSQVLPLALSAVHDASADRDVEAEREVSAAQDALAKARENARTVASVGRQARVDVSRFLLIVTTGVVRGEASMPATEAAQALGVSKAYVSQQVANAKALHSLGTWTPDAFTTVDAARRKGAQVLRDTVARALSAAQAEASAKADEKARDGKASAVPVRVTIAQVKAAATEAGAVVKAAPKPVVLSEVGDYLAKILDRIGTGGADVVGTEADVARMANIVATIGKAVAAKAANLA